MNESASATQSTARQASKGGATARRRSPRGEEARARILQIAIESFAERGYHGTSINEIAKLAGITMPGLLHHFPNKRELFAAMLSEQERRDNALFSTFFPADAGVFDVLEAYVAMAKVNVGRPGVLQLFHLITAESASGEHPYSETAADHFRAARDYVAEGVRHSIERGDVFADADPERIAAQVVGMIQGLENQWLHGHDEVELVEVFRDFVDALAERLRA